MARRWLFILALLAVAPAPKGASAAEPTAAEIANWIEQLGSPKYAEREAASRKLAALDDVSPVLVKATQSSDAEIACRAKIAVKTIERRTLERRFQKELAAINTEGLDLFVERMVRRPGYATDERWRRLECVVEGLSLQAGKIGSNGYSKSITDSTAFPIRTELAQLGEAGSRLLLDGMTWRYNTISRCVVLSTSSLGRISTINQSIVLVLGDIQGGSRLENCFVICTGNIGRITRVENSIILSNGEVTPMTARNNLFQVKSIGNTNRAVGNTFVNLKTVSGASADDNSFPETDQGPFSLVKFWDLSRLGVRLKQVDGQTRVETVESGSPLAQAGLRAGDEWLALGTQKWSSPDDLRDVLKKALVLEKEVTLGIRRGGQFLELTLKCVPEEK
jgi:hypothetical protein